MRHDGNGKFPRNRKRYLQNASNKVELFHYLSVAIAQTVFCEGKVVISTLDENVLGSPVSGADESDYPLYGHATMRSSIRECVVACSECSIARL